MIAFQAVSKFITILMPIQPEYYPGKVTGERNILVLYGFLWLPSSSTITDMILVAQ